MTFPSPSAWLRHRGPALVIDTIDAWDGTWVECGARDAAWAWPRLLEGAAQAAGIACALADERWRSGAVVAEFRDVEIRGERHRGPVRFRARSERVVLAYRRCRAVAATPAGTTLISAHVTLLPDRSPA